MDESKKLSLDLTNLGLLLRDKMKLVKHESDQVSKLKEEIRGIMIENDLKNFENSENNLTLKCSRSFSFDLGMFKLEEKEIAKDFVKEETTTVTNTRDVFDKKGLMKLKPEIYKKYLCENTPRLSVK
jgi:hypothetical protein